MNWFTVSWKNIIKRPLSTLLSIILLAFGTGIIALLINVSEQLEKQLTKNIAGIDMVVGAKGSPLQLILSSVYHIDAPTGNIPLSEYQKLVKNRMVKKGIPLAYGDNFEGYRIVGTEKSYLDHYQAEFQAGSIFNEIGEVVVGAKAAELLELKIGDTFNGNHGLDDAMADTHDNLSYKVVGILQANGSVTDKLILCNIKSVWSVHDHDAHHDEGDKHKHKPKEITAALIEFKSPMGNLTVPRMVNQKTPMQAALPAIEINRLFSLMGTGIQTLRYLAFLIVLISGISVFISLYQSLKDRKFELALMRSMGASKFQLFTIITLEGLIISVIGFGFGILLQKLVLFVLSSMADDAYSYSFNILQFNIKELYLFAGIMALGFLASLLPSLQASRLNISKTLSHG